MLNAATKVSKKKKLIFGSVLVAIITIVSINIVFSRTKQLEEVTDIKFIKAEERIVNNTKLISGHIVPGKMETWHADPIKGQVKEIFVKEGQDVKKGDKLFSYDNEEITLQLKQADLDKKAIAMRQEQEKGRVTTLRKELESLKKSGVDKEDFLPLIEQLKELEIGQATTQLENEKGKLQLEELRKKQKGLTVYSGVNGIVKKIDDEAKQSSLQGKVILQVMSNEPFQIQGTLTELQKSQIKEEQPIIVMAKAVPGKSWNGKVTKVSDYPSVADSSGMEEQMAQNISHYAFKASLEMQEELSPGYHVSIQVKLAEKRIVTIPSSTILEKNGETFVYVNENGKLRKQVVKKGITEGKWVEIIEGIKMNMPVVNNPSEKTYEGMEVKKS